jgi:hypothetical protein
MCPALEAKSFLMSENDGGDGVAPILPCICGFFSNDSRLKVIRQDHLWR